MKTIRKNEKKWVVATIKGTFARDSWRSTSFSKQLDRAEIFWSEDEAKKVSEGINEEKGKPYTTAQPIQNFMRPAWGIKVGHKGLNAEEILVDLGSDVLKEVPENANRWNSLNKAFASPLVALKTGLACFQVDIDQAQKELDQATQSWNEINNALASLNDSKVVQLTAH